MGYQNPADAAMPYFQQIPSTITPYFQPYIDAGQNSLSTLMSQYNTLLTNPGAVVNMAGSGYQQSPGYQYQVNSAENASNNASAAGGMLGTAANQTNDAAIANNLANQDYEQYLNQTLGLYSQGLHGTEGLNEMGYRASDSLAEALAKNLMSEGGIAYKGVAGQNQYNMAQNASNMGLIGSLFGDVSGLLF